MSFLKQVEDSLKEKTILNEIIEFSREYFDKNEKYIIKYLNKRRIGVKTVKEIKTGLLSKNLQVIIPRITKYDNLRYVINPQLNNSLFFPSFRSDQAESFVGIIRNTKKDHEWRYKILKIIKDGNNFFHNGNYPQDQLILVEGIFDKLRLIQADLFSVPINGTKVDIDIIAEEFKNTREIILFLDGDEPAKIKTIELVFNYLTNRDNFNFDLSVIKTPENLDPCDLDESRIKTLYKYRLSAKNYIEFIFKNCINEKDKIQSFIKSNIFKHFNF